MPTEGGAVVRCIIHECPHDAQHPRVAQNESIVEYEQTVFVCDGHLSLFDEWQSEERPRRSWSLLKDEDGRLISLWVGDRPLPASQFPTRTLIGLLKRRGTQSFIEVAEMRNSAGAWVPVSPLVLRDTGAPIAIEPGDVIDFSGEPVEIEPVASVVN